MRQLGGKTLKNRGRERKLQYVGFQRALVAQPEPCPPLMYSIKLKPLGYLDSDAVVARESKTRVRPFMLEGPKAREE